MIPSSSFVKQATSQNLSSESSSESSRIPVPLLSSLSISPVKDFTSTVSLIPANQHQSVVPFNTNQQLDALANQPGQFLAMGQQTQQVSQQPFIIQQQSGAQIFPPSDESYSQISHPQQQHTQSLSYQRQMESAQQPTLSQSSQFPTFPSFDQLAFSLP
ncbi:hypothetical protein LOAG_08345 [Loa loa]|nr:hypothetical protein LOAG_08345 [Loa loa]EFO20142.1 hypothetical protein LOAG_08345 [Loa loa]